MKLVLEKPFSDDWKRGYLQKNREGRNIVCLVKTSTERTTVAYARYLMSVKLGRYLTKEETVDHIDNDKTNDSIDNLQLLSPLENISKYYQTLPAPEHGTRIMYRKGCRCDLCKQWKQGENRRYRTAHPEALERRAASKAVEKVCEFCGNTFYRSLSHKNARFCSKHCAMMGRYHNK